MSGLEDLKIRLQYNGGYKQESRMQLDKLRTLKKALIYSYQAATAILEDGREFRCLINPDKNKLDYDDKIISIPYKDICLNKEKNKLIKKHCSILKFLPNLRFLNVKPWNIEAIHKIYNIHDFDDILEEYLKIKEGELK